MDRDRVIREMAFLAVFQPRWVVWTALHERYGMERHELWEIAATQEFRDALKHATFMYLYMPRHKELSTRRMDRAASGDAASQRAVFETFLGEGVKGVELSQTRVSGLSAEEFKELMFEGLSGERVGSSSGSSEPSDRVVDVGVIGVGEGSGDGGGGAVVSSCFGDGEASVSGVEVSSSREAAVGESESVQDHDVHRGESVGQDDVVDQ